MFDCIAGVEGYIKITFDSISTDKGFSYGSGAITDGVYKLPICIAQYSPNSQFVEGAHVSVKGNAKINKTRKSFLK